MLMMPDFYLYIDMTCQLVLNKAVIRRNEKPLIRFFINIYQCVINICQCSTNLLLLAQQNPPGYACKRILKQAGCFLGTKHG